MTSILRMYTLDMETGKETVEELTLTPELICAVYVGCDGYNNWQHGLEGMIYGR